jgi:hypothetical protein
MKEAEVLQTKKDFILNNAEYMSSPQQNNHYDCGFFALATVLHLVKGKKVDLNIYSQDNITELRDCLYKIYTHDNIKKDFPDPVNNLSATFIYSFFPYLADDNNDDPYINFFNKKIKAKENVIDLITQTQTQDLITQTQENNNENDIEENTDDNDDKFLMTFIRLRLQS